MERMNPKSRSDAYGSRINRAHSPILANIVPYSTIMLGSLLPIFMMASGMPIVPPLGFLMLIAWRLVRPGLLPLWAGLPLGLFDDLFSGQPFGFAILTWSITMIGIELLEIRLPWRGFWQDWFTAGIATMAYLLLGVAMSGTVPTAHHFIALVPQLVFSIMLYPIIARMVSRLDRLRLMRVRSLA